MVLFTVPGNHAASSRYAESPADGVTTAQIQPAPWHLRHWRYTNDIVVPLGLAKLKPGLTYTVQVHILFFGVLKDLVGQTSESIVVREGATLADVLSHYEARIPELKQLLPSLAISVNQQYAGPEVKLNSNDEIGFLPPVSGGSESGACPHVAILGEKIDSLAVLQRLKHPEDGAAVVFEGVVRDNTRGRRTLYLDYEAYEPMALTQMEELAVQALHQFKIRDLRMVHRVGRLEIGETSVLIAVASAHREAAFDACRWLIDTLKRTVPIWKKEYFDDGAVWADGEPFPVEIPRAEGTPVGKPASK